MTEKIAGQIQKAEMVLIGIGTEFSQKTREKEQILSAYEKLAELVKEKDYFLVTLNTDDLIYETGFQKERIVAPCGSDRTGNVVTNENYDESGYLPQWEVYTKWLQNTLHKKVCVLELGVGFEYPSVIRFPFEKVVFFNQKSSFVRVHSQFAQLTPEIKERSLAVGENPVDVLLQSNTSQ